jgi:predicted DNA-binding transcriptional regulator AlpA
MKKLIRYNDLVAKGVVNSRMTLKRLIDTQDFPPGLLITPNARAWEEESVDTWTANRPVARKASTRSKVETVSAPDAPAQGPSHDGGPNDDIPF